MRRKVVGQEGTNWALSDGEIRSNTAVTPTGKGCLYLSLLSLVTEPLPSEAC